MGFVRVVTWICQKFIGGFVKVVPCNNYDKSMYLSKLLYVFVKVVACISRQLKIEIKLGFYQ